MNAITLLNIKLMTASQESAEYISMAPVHIRSRKSHKSMASDRDAFIRYIYKHGQATGMELKRNCEHSNAQPSMALRPYIRNGCLEYIKEKWNRTSYYKLAKGITAKALGIEE